jgi:hypothetical protein
MAEDLRLRGLATTELERTREKNAVLLSEAAAEIESRQLRASAELRQLDQEATERATSIRAAAEDFSTMAISRAAAEASATHAITVAEIEQARSETAVLRSTAAAQIASDRDAAAAEAHRVLCDAADHMNWTQDTVARCCRPPKPRPTGCVTGTTREVPSTWPPAVGSCMTSFPASPCEYEPQ